MCPVNKFVKAELSLETTSPGHLGKVKHGADVQGAEAVYEE